MNENMPSTPCDDLAALARSGPGYPTRLAKALHGRIGMFRGHDDAVQSFEPPGQGGYVWEIDPAFTPDVGLGPLDASIADSPAALSDQLLAILFGQWPPTGAPSAVAPRRRGPAIVVRELSWAEWLAVINPAVA